MKKNNYFSDVKFIVLINRWLRKGAGFVQEQAFYLAYFRVKISSWLI